MSDSRPAVFLSYASQDADAARRIAEALRVAGVDVWFDQNDPLDALGAHGLVGGDAWDAKIRRQIGACALFVPIISAATQARLEGYFRLEWKLAALRTHAMAEAKPFLLPVVIDATPDADAHVPAEFKAVQWTRLRPAARDFGGQAREEASVAAFCARVKTLMAGDVAVRGPSFAPKSSSEPRVETSLQPIPEKSVAVLAFDNLSPDPENEYFSDGLSEDLIGMLGRVPGLTVRGRTSAFSFKGKNVPMPEIARQLNVSYVVRGSVRKAGNRVRISAQLTRAADDEVVWSSAPLERELKDVFAVQDEVVALIAQNLSLTLGGAARPAKTVNPEAHRLVLEGHYFWNRGTAADMDRGEAAFAKATAIDPDFAEAQAGLAKVGVLRVLYRWTDGGSGDPAELREAREVADRAVRLDPNNPDALAVQAMAHLLEGKFDAAEARFQAALRLNPNATLPHLWHGLLLSNRGHLAAAIAENAKAIELDPLWLPPLVIHALILVEAQRFAAALEFTERAATLRDAPYVPNLLYRVMALRGLHRDAEAVEVARRVRDRITDQPRWGADIAAVEAMRHAGHPGEAEAFAAELFASVPTDALAVRGAVLVGLGRFDEALLLFENFPVTSRRSLFWHQFWDPWRNDPRFQQLLEKIGCADDYARARDALAQVQEADATSVRMTIARTHG